MPKQPPRLLTIAGSDSGGGAGIQADLKTFQALGCYGMSVVTAFTAQNTIGVCSIFSVPHSFVEDQLNTVLEDIGVDAIKIGMLANSNTIEAIAAILKRYRHIPIVLDPVMIAKGGSPLLNPDAADALKELLLPLATVLTPNIPEAEVLTSGRIADATDMESAARLLCKHTNSALIKGGHLDLNAPNDPLCIDLLLSQNQCHWLTHPRIDTPNTHGTGCTYASAIAAGLGHGQCLYAAVHEARLYLQAAIVSGSQFQYGTGHGPVHHAVDWRHESC